MKLNFKTRIALYYMIATGIIMAVVFLAIFFVVQNTVYNNLDKDLDFEAHKHSKEVTITRDTIYFSNKAELEEREHLEVQVNPVFLQITDASGKLFDKSPNLKGNNLIVIDNQQTGKYNNTTLTHIPIRQVQLPLYHDGRKHGYIIAAMSLTASLNVITNLKYTLLILYPVVLLGLFLISSFLAGRSIKPIRTIIDTTNRISRNNLNERVIMAHQKDELYELSQAINALLHRLKNTIERERQFTSDASHELRTPLATLRGTLEVLIRKSRSQQEYEEKINFSISIIDFMTLTLEQLLTLARMENPTSIAKNNSTFLSTLIDDILSKYKREITAKNLKINLELDDALESKVHGYYANLILDNIIENAIKYSRKEGVIHISIKRNKNDVLCTIQDEGIGIRKEELDKLFNNFYRSDALEHKHISGNGLGLSIVKKSVEAIGAEIKIESKYKMGTTCTIVFKKG
ncbi:sensor histidine kinase [Flavimarina sp. Hel_I_48]|uniref:sensor histidine kinase n=1 Tax=Flavimarina sp. Hel_I_48 TaxID=1392488 RepID=UPI0004DEF524|nr:HAMP domain-containing sensor histidine kinase [Flavimarina sp. Hel_I_48]